MTCNSKISCLSWNVKEKGMLASSDYEGCVTLWDVVSGDVVVKFDVRIKIKKKEHEKRAWSVDFSESDPQRLASGGDDSKGIS